MSFLGWMALAGVVLLSMAFASAYVQRLPVSSAMLYLVLGVALGPRGVAWLALDAIEASRWLVHVTEVVVIVSLFSSGLHLRLPLRDPAWAAAWRLAGPVMIACILGVAAFAHVFLGLDLATAILLGALLAPTDPVLAGDVAVSDASDCDRLRYGLTGEAGLNDGTAFPFVVFALTFASHDGRLGAWTLRWALERVLWAVPVGLAVGFGLGWMVGRLAIHLRTRTLEIAAASDFLALSLIALSYVAAEAAHAWGFLAAFAAGLGLRHAEVAIHHASPPPKPEEVIETADRLDPRVDPAEALVERRIRPEALEHPAVASGAVVSEVLSFGDTLERLLEVIAVILVGALVGTLWDARALAVAAALFLVIRPAAVAVGLARTPTTASQRRLIGWFGIRGIGSLYYLAYAITHGLGRPQAAIVAKLTLSVVAISIVVHGATATPILARYERSLGTSKGA